MKKNPLVDVKDRIYYIDLLRALAIMLVVLAHSIAQYGAPSHLAPLQLGGTGVDLFFLLSGWLIGSQLFKERQRFDDIDVKRFWIRRWMRTLPAYYAVLALTLLQQYLFKENVTTPLPHLFFYQNYTDPSYFTISWSLALEEQFYLVIAPAILLLHRFSKSFQTSVLVILLILPSYFRALGWYDSLEETHVRWDCCVMGVLLANIYYQYPRLWEKVKPHTAWVALTGLLLYISFFWTRYVPDFGTVANPNSLILAFVFAAFVIYAVNSPIKKLPIAHKTIMHISTRSYAMYLLHVEALALTSRLFPNINFIYFLIITIVVTLIVSELLFRFVEQPFLHLRDKHDFSKSRRQQPTELAKNIDY